jgi:DNA-directed RNA polymerase subunit H (RpoH/RPB5)
MSVKIEIVKEMMVQRGFEEYKNGGENYLMGKSASNTYIYIKIFKGKFELNVVREFLWSKFSVNSNGDITYKKNNNQIVQLVIVCKSFQNSHVKEFKEISNHIQLIRSDFFNINITKKAPYHHKIENVFNINKREIPALKDDDPNCIFYNFVKGDVIRVVRSNGDICYRLVR